METLGKAVWRLVMSWELQTSLNVQERGNLLLCASVLALLVAAQKGDVAPTRKCL